MNEPLLDRPALERAFSALAEELSRAGVRADVYVFGGAAMVLAYGQDRATRDVAAVFEPHGAVLTAAQAVAARYSLPRWWLNEQAAVYVGKNDVGAAPVFDHPNLRVAAASPEHMAAMKARAARSQDLDDLRVLIRLLELQSPAEVLDIVARVFPDDPLPERKRLLIEDLFA